MALFVRVYSRGAAALKRLATGCALNFQLHRIGRWAFGIVLVVGLSALSASGETDAAGSAPELDLLFEQLAETESVVDAEFIQNLILETWAVSKSPTATLLYHRGLETLVDGDEELALELFSAVTEIAPNFAEGWFQLGALHFDLEAHDVAIHEFERALRIEPRHFGALLGLAALFEVYGNGRGALEALRRLRVLNPNFEGLDDRIEALEVLVQGRGI